MIDLGKPAIRSHGVAFLPDHADPLRYHCLPEAPQLRRRLDGTFELTLLKYRLDPDLNETLGAGLLSFTVDLGIDEEVLSAASARLRAVVQAEQQLRVTPVQAQGGYCEVVVIDSSSQEGTDGSDAADSPMVHRILGSTGLALYGANAATFQVVLSPEGVALVEGALLEGGLPIGVVYHLETTGLRPAMRATIRARWRDMYEFFENRFHGGKLLLAADLGETTEDLIRRELLIIEVDDLVPPDEQLAVHRSAVAQAERYVLEKLFKPTLGQQPPADDPDGDSPLEIVGRALKDVVGLVSFEYSLKNLQRDELKTFEYRLAASTAERMTLAPQGSLALLTGEADASTPDLSAVVRTVEPTVDPQMTFDVGSLVGLEREEVDHIEVWLRYGETEEHRVLESATPRVEVPFWYDADLGTEIEHRYEAHLHPGTDGFGVVLASAPARTQERVIRIDPTQLYQRHRVHALAQGIPFDIYPRVIVDLSAQDHEGGRESERTLVLTAETAEGTWSVRGPLERPLRFKRRLRYVDTAGQETIDDWETFVPGILIVPHPAPDVRDLLILGSARFGSVVQRLIVELRPHSDPSHVTTRILTAEASSANWAWPVPAESAAGYDYRITVHHSSGQLKEGVWTTGTPGKLVVGEGGRVRDVELLFVGGTFEALDLLALKIRFAFRDAEAGLESEDERVVQDLSAPIRWSYPVADAERQAYSYQLTLIKRDGTSEVRPPVETSDLLVVQPLV